MNNVKHQYEVIQDFIEHLESKISQGASGEEYEKFTQAKIKFLDTLADLLMSPQIAKAWDFDDEKLPKMKSAPEMVDEFMRESNARANKNLAWLVGVVVAVYTLGTVIYLIANFHK